MEWWSFKKCLFCGKIYLSYITITEHIYQVWTSYRERANLRNSNGPNYMFVASLLAEICVNESWDFVCKRVRIWCRCAFGVGLRYGMRPHPTIFAAISSKPPTMVNTEALSAAIVDLRSQKKPNFFAIIKKNGINKTILWCRFQNKQIPWSVNHIEI